MTHHLTDKDFSACVFNPLIKKELSKAYPDLQEVLDCLPEEADGIARYIIALYDQNSPLTKMYPELAARKQVAAAVAGIYNRSEAFLDNLFDFKKDWFLKAVSTYLRLFGATKTWMIITSCEEMFQEYFERTMVKISTKTVDEEGRVTHMDDADIIRATDLKNKLRKEMVVIAEDLGVFYRKLYGDDSELLNQSKALRFTPEMVALKIKETKGV